MFFEVMGHRHSTWNVWNCIFLQNMQWMVKMRNIQILKSKPAYSDRDQRCHYSVSKCTYQTPNINPFQPIATILCFYQELHWNGVINCEFIYELIPVFIKLECHGTHLRHKFLPIFQISDSFLYTKWMHLSMHRARQSIRYRTWFQIKSFSNRLIHIQREM